MKYMLLLAAAEERLPYPGAPNWDEYFNAFMTFNQHLVEQGVYLGGEPLLPAATATTVRRERDETLVTDGPFAETKEQIGGVFIIECKDLDEALNWAKQVPTVAMGFGAAEVRPCAGVER